MLWVSGDGLLLAVNRAAEQAGLGARGSRLADLVRPARGTLEDYLDSCVRGPQAVSVSLAAAPGNGKPATFECSGSLLAVHEQPSQRRLVLRLTPSNAAASAPTLSAKVEELGSEIERRNQIEVELVAQRERARQSERRLRVALTAGRMGTWEWNLSTNDVLWSPGLESLHGLAPGAFGGTFEAYLSDIHPDDRQRVLNSLTAAVTTGQEHHLEYRLVWPDGSVHWIEARGTLFSDAGGRPVGMVGVCVDITERKRSENVARFLAEASRSLASLVDDTSTLGRIARLAVPFFADCCVVYLEQNGALGQLAAAHVDPEKGRALEELGALHAPRPSDPMGPWKVFRTGRPQLIERVSEQALLASAADEQHLGLLQRLAPRSLVQVPLWIGGRVGGVLSFGSAESGRHYTATDLALAEDLAHRAAIAIENARLYVELREADRRKNDFLAMLAHELRNPLAPVRAGLDLLALDGSARDVVSLLQQQVDHLVRLVDDLLDVARIMRGRIQLRPEPVDLATIVERGLEIARPLVAAQEHSLEVRLPRQPVWLEADPVRMAQVVSNLVHNAAKYTKKGGRIELEGYAQDRQAILRVRDNGVGIAKDLLTRIFDLCWQADRSLERSQGGLGIGLALVRNLVEMHGGVVSAHSAGENRGCEFVVRLPLRETPPKVESRPPPNAPARRLRVLIVDDNVGMATLLVRLVRKLGDHEIHTAYDGLTGLEKACAERFDLILLDIGLPQLDGYEVARRLRERPDMSRPLIVALTGYGADEDRRRSRQAGFDAHLVKPISIDALRQLCVHPKLAPDGPRERLTAEDLSL